MKRQDLLLKILIFRRGKRLFKWRYKSHFAYLKERYASKRAMQKLEMYEEMAKEHLKAQNDANLNDEKINLELSDGRVIIKNQIKHSFDAKFSEYFQTIDTLFEAFRWGEFV